MNSLVGYGVSSDSDSDGESLDQHCSESSGQEVCYEQPVKKSRNFLETDFGSASSDSEPEEEEEPQVHFDAPQTSNSSPTRSHKVNKLPPPSLQTSSDTSVFTNPFKAQAQQKLSALQKHVPLTVQPRPSHIGGRRVCVSYRKDGRCRFGIKCKYAHDSDLQSPPPDSQLPQAGEDLHGRGFTSQGSQQDNEEKAEGQQVKKRRVGLSDTLIPPKRAMKQYVMQRGKERNVL